MKHRLLLLIALLILPTVFFAQGFGLPPGFDLKQFNKNEEMALWFIKYDSMIVRVQTFDRGTVGKDFICFEDKKGWKVVAGRIDSARGIIERKWFAVDAKNVVTEMKKEGDTVLITSMGHALYNGAEAHKKLKLSTTTIWKRYIRQNADLTFTVSYFCDQDASGVIWYGPECNWWYSSDGMSLVTTKISANKTPLMASSAGNFLNFSCPAEKMPTVGTVWMAHRIGTKYPNVHIIYKTGTSTLTYNPTTGSYSWMHAAN
jgi:hypothetical protein